ncbi:uncharacterized protein HaLaN_18621 [Haematococcus lacustris]|uniref:Uncharacterized protein n=1 Tax=Haematococcus lacustris TaxID=44745 RepID=A0A699ZSK4_HAELA|nr:uncharacterized protein HaLaN_18621 [Haematococcus lacustris]
MLQQLQVFCMYFANSSFLNPYNQLQRRLGRAGQNKHFSLKPAFDDPSNQELLAKLQQLGSANFTGDHNTISHHSMQLAVAMQQHYSNPGKAQLGWSGEEAQLFIKLTFSAASGVWDPATGQLLHLAAASSAGTSLEANQKHITVTLATWDAVWEVYLDPKWAEQRLRLYGAQDRTLEQFFKKLEEKMAEVAMERHGRAKQLVVFFGAASIGTRGGWGADAVLRACCKVVCRPRGTDQRRGRVVLVDEHRTSRVSSAVNGQQPCEGQLSKRRATRPAGWKPPAGQVHQRLLRPAWSQQRDLPRIGESKWRPLELCYWPEQGALPAKGKEYPGLGYKRVRDKPPKAQPAAAL